MAQLMHVLVRSALVLVVVLGSAGLAQETGEWEYLVVTYGTTYFMDPLLDLEDTSARSKILMLSELGITLPNEAAELQRNTDVLGRFGWELVAVVGSIGGDQQLMFKRPYDADRSAQEAARISEEREALLAAYNALPAETDTELVDLDAVEFYQELDARNARDVQHVRSLVADVAEEAGFTVLETDVLSLARNAAVRPDVRMVVTLDVSEIALVGNGLYRSSLVDDALRDFRAALFRGSFSIRRDHCTATGGNGQAVIGVDAVIVHNGTPTRVGDATYNACFHGP